MFGTKSHSLANMLAFMCIILSVQYAASDIIPVFMFGNGIKSESIPLGPIGAETFQEIVKSNQENKPRMIIFMERNLSPEDFIELDQSGKSTFKHLSKLELFNYLPYVENPLDVLKQLEGHKIVQTSINNFSNKQKLAENDILIIDLNDAKDNEDRSEMLRRHDDVMHTIVKDLKNEKILFMYTGQHASWITPEVATAYKSRNILATKEDTVGKEKIINTTTALIYFNSSVMYFDGTKMNEISDFTGKEDPANTIVLTSGIYNLELKFNETLTGYWIWTDMSFKVNSDAIKFKFNSISAPKRFSYHCQSLTFMDNENKNITFPGIQIQPYMEGGSKGFGDAYDCVGFTSAPIWSGLFVTFILAFIMTMGLTMMMDIKTMDRFDDPKGKTIIINASE